MPNTGWSSNAPPASSCPVGSFSSLLSGPFAFGASGRAPPMFLEKAILGSWLLVLALAVRVGMVAVWVGVAAAAASIGALSVIAAVLAPDVTGRRLWA